MDGLTDLSAFADRLEKAVIGTIEGGVMTGDLALIYEGDATTVTSRAFLRAVRERLEYA